ncbi:MAG: S41 family peptidase [Cyanobacteria bacterium REEB67]|nr:S41 family peptidase [Cyanobacteria bacterium REEB67]
MPVNPIDALSGRALYAAIWQRVKDSFFDQARLAAIDWAGQEHRYDAKIVDDAAAIRFAKKSLRLLNDKYTCFLEPEQVVAKAADRVSEELLVANKVMEGDIGYLGIISFSHADIAEQVRERLEGIAHCRAFIVDLRGNTGGLVNATANALEYFIDSGDICYSDHPLGAKGLEERFIYFKPDQFCVLVLEPGVEPDLSFYLRKPAMIAGKPMVVLIDGNTMSSAEIFAAALLASGENGSIIAMGSKSSGKGIGQSDFDILGKVTLKLSCSRFYNPAGDWTGDDGQTVNNGIVPKIELVESDDPVAQVRAAASYLTDSLAARASQEALPTPDDARLAA